MWYSESKPTNLTSTSILTSTWTLNLTLTSTWQSATQIATAQSAPAAEKGQVQVQM